MKEEVDRIGVVIQTDIVSFETLSLVDIKLLILAAKVTVLCNFKESEE